MSLLVCVKYRESMNYVVWQTLCNSASQKEVPVKWRAKTFASLFVQLLQKFLLFFGVDTSPGLRHMTGLSHMTQKLPAVLLDHGFDGLNQLQTVRFIWQPACAISLD